MSFISAFLSIILELHFVICQIDLGSISLGQDKRGDLKIGFNQAANILGFGGDRGLDLTIGEGRLNTKARHGALIAGERVGLDSNFGLNEAEGVNLGNFLNFGNNPISSYNPAGQLISFLENISKFFISGGKELEPRSSFLSSSNNPDINIGNGFRNFGAKQKIFVDTINYTQSGNDNYDDYYHNIKDEITEEQFNTTTESSSNQKN